MKKLLVGALVSFGLAGWASADGDAAAGQSKAAACVACHGQGGNSTVPSFPKLAGQNERYLVKQMQDIQCGFLSADEQKASKCSGRSVAQMAGQLDNFNDQDLADIAAYFAAQPASGGQAKAELVAKGAEIYAAGIRSKGVAACAGCHSPTGKGNAPAGFPRLSGQHADYVAAQLKAFRAAADGDHNGRSNDGDTQMMRANAYPLSDNEIEAVASYISGLY
ncbi:cytochrome c4 [Dasania sp. GY-MA-18]|uniref:Cytochrome c4 n=1 Tax=Dasania phycosphaerae TaxID=2950436 RepID=A0A9J6RNV6_9GAMM|nr:MULTISPECIES: cytochrome c4 [Dasania]MCR8923754.1 cytochrome c4 [Dasania sp. GY-MA-18]MCZ0866188.1 cytochrome c4 [Dasania phycosphaerae]MCZ0869912.1 cytochrome c4 [Dasania phycosphaerae]